MSSIQADSDLPSPSAVSAGPSSQRPLTLNKIASSSSSDGSSSSASSSSHHYHAVADAPEARLLTPTRDFRQIIRMVQCRLCSRIIRNPVFLPCGQSLCRRCLPEYHLRSSISQSGRVREWEAFTCSFAHCGEEHAAEDCSFDIILNKVLHIFGVEVESVRSNPGTCNASTTAIVHSAQDPWTSVPIQQDPVETEELEGGRIVSTYVLAESGKLQYGHEVSYRTEDASDGEIVQKDTQLLARIKNTVRPEMDCQICFGLFLEPVTTTCGHTFCRECLTRVLDYSSQCPACRQYLRADRHMEHTPFVRQPNERLFTIIDGFWAEIAAQRAEKLSAEKDALLEDSELPLFVCTVAIPTMPMCLHVFEPRYRLMIRRAMQKDRMFGMVLPKSPTDPGAPHFEDAGTILRITNIHYFEDGRSMIETRGVSRFRVLRYRWLDDYVVGHVEKIEDVGLIEQEEIETRELSQAQATRNSNIISAFDVNAPSLEDEIPEIPPASYQDVAGSTASATPNSATASVDMTSPAFTTTFAELETMSTQQLVDIGLEFAAHMLERMGAVLSSQVLETFKECPRDAARLPWWFASILPLRESEKNRIIQLTTVRARLKLCCSWILEWKALGWTFTHPHLQ